VTHQDHKTDPYLQAGGVGRLGLEPRTHGLKVGRLAVPGVLAAQIPRMDARKAHIAQGCGRHSSHESFHSHQAEGRGIVTERSQNRAATVSAYPVLSSEPALGTSELATPYSLGSWTVSGASVCGVGCLLPGIRDGVMA
jgi:hypothetical protein